MLAGNEWWHGNILLTLALGVGMHQAIQVSAGTRRLRRIVPPALMLLPSPLVDVGPVGVASIPLIAALAARNLSAGAWASGPVGLLGNLEIVVPFLKLADVSALSASPVAALSLRVALRMPRLPTHFFHAYYPGHLLVLHLIAIRHRRLGVVCG